MRHRISQHHTCRLSFISLSSLHSSNVLVQYWQMLLPRSTCRRGEYCRQSHRGEYKRYFDWFICRGSTRWLLSPIVECEGRCLYSQCYHSIINDHNRGRQEAGGAQMCNCLHIVTEDFCVVRPCPNLLSKSWFGCKISKNPNLKLGFVILHSVVSTCLPISIIWISQFFENNNNRLVGGHRRSHAESGAVFHFYVGGEQLSCVTLSRWPNIVDIAPVTGGGACHTLSHSHCLCHKSHLGSLQWWWCRWKILDFPQCQQWTMIKSMSFMFKQKLDCVSPVTRGLFTMMLWPCRYTLLQSGMCAAAALMIYLCVLCWF